MPAGNYISKLTIKTLEQQKQRRKVFCKKGILKNVTKFTGKHLWILQHFKEDPYSHNTSSGYFSNKA